MADLCRRCRKRAERQRRAEAARTPAPAQVGVVVQGWRPAGPTLLERVLKALRPFVIVGDR